MKAAPLASLERFASLARDFLVAAEAADLASMDAIMARRRNLLDRIATPSDVAELREESAGDRRRELLESILDLDRRAAELLSEHRDEAGRELARLEEGRRGLGGYRAGSTRSAKWIDARG